MTNLTPPYLQPENRPEVLPLLKHLSREVSMRPRRLAHLTYRKLRRLDKLVLRRSLRGWKPGQVFEVLEIYKDGAVLLPPPVGEEGSNVVEVKENWTEWFDKVVEPKAKRRKKDA